MKKIASVQNDLSIEMLEGEMVETDSESYGFKPGGDLIVSEVIETESKITRYLEFDGVSDYIEIPNSKDSLSMAGKDEFTLQAWRRFDHKYTTNAEYTGNIISKEHTWWGSQPAEYVFAGDYHSTNDNEYRFYILLRLGSSTKRMTFISDFYIKGKLPVWVNYTATYRKEGNVHTIVGYVHDEKGNLIHEASESTTDFVGVDKGGYNVNIYRSPRTGKATAGGVRGVKIWGKALSQEEVKDSLFSTEVIEGMIAYWKVDEGTGIIVQDSLGNHNGVINGADWRADVESENKFSVNSKGILTTSEFIEGVDFNG